MRVRWHNPIRRQAARSAVAFVVLAAYLAASQGVMPSAAWLTAHAPWAERFPCEECGCGCANARDCWTQCCCHTLAERLEWARANGVAPPEYVRPLIAAAAAVASESKEGCGHSCCRKTAESEPAGSKGPMAAGSKGRVPAGPRMSALGCRGVAQLIFIAPPFSMGEPACLMAAPAAFDAVVDVRRQDALERSMDVPHPPPRG